MSKHKINLTNIIHNDKTNLPKSYFCVLTSQISRYNKSNKAPVFETMLRLHNQRLFLVTKWQVIINNEGINLYLLLNIVSLLLQCVLIILKTVIMIVMFNYVSIEMNTSTDRIMTSIFQETKRNLCHRGHVHCVVTSEEIISYFSKINVFRLYCKGFIKRVIF